MPDLDLPASHRALLQQAVDHFRDDGRVMGLVLGGSLAHGLADSYSDILRLGLAGVSRHPRIVLARPRHSRGEPDYRRLACRMVVGIRALST